MKKTLPKETLFAYAAILLATAIWAAAVPIIKTTLTHLPPVLFLFYRFLLVAIVLLIPTILELTKTPIAKKDIKNIILIGLSGQASLILIFVGLKYTSSIDTAILGTISPILGLVAGYYFFNERLSKTSWIGIFLTIVGTLVVVLEPVLITNSKTNDTILRLWGNTLVILYNIVFTIYILWVKLSTAKEIKTTSKNRLSVLHIQPLSKHYSPLLITSISFYVGLAVTTVVIFFERYLLLGTKTPIQTLDFTNLPAIAGIVYMAIFSSIIAYMAFSWGLKKAMVADTSIFGYLGPVFTLPFSYLILAEIPTTPAIIGSTLIAAGVLIAERYKS